MSRMRCGMRLLKQAWIILLMLWMLLDGFSFVGSRGIDSVAYGRASSPAGEAFFQAVARALIVGGALRSTMRDLGEHFHGEPGIADWPPTGEVSPDERDGPRSLDSRFSPHFRHIDRTIVAF